MALLSEKAHGATRQAVGLGDDDYFAFPRVVDDRRELCRG